MTSRSHFMFYGLIGCENTCEEIGVLMNLHSAVARIAGGDHFQSALHRGSFKSRLFVAGSDAASFGEDPDLEQVHGVRLGRVVLAMSYSSSGAHSLHFSRSDYRTRSHTVAVLQC